MVRFCTPHKRAFALELYLDALNTGNRADSVFDPSHAMLAGHALHGQLVAL
jgi:hypothetical protein